MGESSTNSLTAVRKRLRRSAQYLRRILPAYWPLLRAQFAQHDCLTAAAALTFTSLLAIVPLMTVTYIGLSLVPQYGDLWIQVQDFIFRNFVPASSELVQQKLTEFAGRARGLTTAGGIGLLLVTLLMLVSIEKRFNAIWQVSTPSSGLQRVLVYWGLLSLAPALLLIAVWSSVYLLGLPLLNEIRVLDFYATALSYLPALLMVVGFTALYVVVPNSSVPFPHGLSGAC
jgi:membrane protein